MDDKSKYVINSKAPYIDLSLSIINNIPNPIIISNPDISIRYVNTAFERLTGFSLPEVVGATAPYPWWPREKHARYLREFNLIRTGKQHKPEWMFRSKDDRLFWIRAAAMPVKEDGEVRYMMASWFDITEYKNRENTSESEINKLSQVILLLLAS